MSNTCQTKTDDRKTEGAAAPLVLLGVTGCIAAYKSCEILRGLQKAGVRVKVVMTKNAASSSGRPRSAPTHEPVAVDTFGDGPGDPIHHVSLAEECDLFLIAPCTANVLAKMAAGIADDLLSTTCARLHGADRGGARDECPYVRGRGDAAQHAASRLARGAFHRAWRRLSGLRRRRARSPRRPRGHRIVCP